MMMVLGVKNVQMLDNLVSKIFRKLIMATKCPKCGSRRIIKHDNYSTSDVTLNGVQRAKVGATTGGVMGKPGMVIGAIVGFLWGVVEGTPDDRECKSCHHTWFEGSS